MSRVLDVDELDPLVGAVGDHVGELDDVGDGDGRYAQYDVRDSGVPDEALRLDLALRVVVMGV